MNHASLNFYKDLPLVNDFKAIFKPDCYQELPQDWWIVITDIKASTAAIEQGRYRDINSLGGCTVAAILNAVKPTAIPYIFGGDGATFCIPSQLIEQVSSALRGCIKLASDSFNLELRAALIPYQTIQPKAKVLVACYAKSDSLHQAIFVGGGLNEAEKQIKSDAKWHVQLTDDKAEADLTGFECRWNRIASPQEVTVSLIVQAINPDIDQQLALYQQLMQKMQTYFGEDEQLQPLSVDGLELMYGKQYLTAEADARTFTKKNSYFFNLWDIRIQNFIGKVLMKLKLKLGKANWGRYKEDTLLNSDYRKLDDAFRIVFAAKKSVLAEFETWLASQEAAGAFSYGLHISDAAQLTCLISQLGVKHIHFVDGCDGGYALAAKSLKQKQKQSGENNESI
ncbi:DUF3095 family protein [Marinospirillum insulare]|uniref:DUF3095 domain-containing protein n=1 Tax=Marinospirillum insulare TaxID=217169 RepID=A0ABQ6A0Q1_9GAMM|nr:DUF3095 family protein [Marinospirillum insulare]GLR65168.1 hypothetical protein GCM10007878_26070 [Marinospirillum insulare]